MLRRFVPSAALALMCAFYAPEAQADPIFFNIANCVSGDCASFAASGGGSIVAEINVVNGSDLLITLTNNLHQGAANDDPLLTNLGFDYGGTLSGLTFDSFQVLSGVVATPTFTVDTTIRSFFIDFGFNFSQATRTSERAGQFGSGEVVRILVGTNGLIDPSEFDLGIAKVGGTGANGVGGAAVLTGSPSASVPEPGSLMALMIGFGAFGLRRRRTISARTA